MTFLPACPHDAIVEIVPDIFMAHEGHEYAGNARTGCDYPSERLSVKPVNS